MTPKANFMNSSKKLLLCSVALFLGLTSCNKSGAERESEMISILTAKEVQAVLEGSGDSLIAFDLWADWCGPCRAIAPTLERIASQNKGRVTFYRINVDQVPEAGQAFQISGIPYVAFVKSKRVVASFTGAHPEEEYLQAIRQFSGASAARAHLRPENL
jgi:thioredoxin